MQIFRRNAHLQSLHVLLSFCAAMGIHRQLQLLKSSLCLLHTAFANMTTRACDSTHTYKHDPQLYSLTTIQVTLYSLMWVLESKPFTELPRGSLYMFFQSISGSGTGLAFASITAVSTSFFTACTGVRSVGTDAIRWQRLQSTMMI